MGPLTEESYGSLIMGGWRFSPKMRIKRSACEGATMTLDDLLADDGRPKHLKMLQFIQTHFRDELGPDMLLLDQPGGLERLQAKYTGLWLARQQRCKVA